MLSSRIRTHGGPAAKRTMACGSLPLCRNLSSSRGFLAPHSRARFSGRVLAKHRGVSLSSATSTRASFLFSRNYFPGRASCLIFPHADFFSLGSTSFSFLLAVFSLPRRHLTRKLFNSGPRVWHERIQRTISFTSISGRFGWFVTTTGILPRRRN